MPRLFDLLPDNTKKELIAEARKASEKKKSKKREKAPPPGEQSARKTPYLPIPNFVAFDVETTGLDFKNDRIIEVGAVKFLDRKPCAEFTTCINAGVPIPPHITDLTGIRNEDICTAPDFGAIADKLLQFIDGLPLCGHQVEFDATFLNEELKRIGRQTISGQLLDTALLSRILLQPLQRFSLKAVSESLEVRLQNAHRALDDARASGEIAVHLIPKLAELPLHVRQTMAACAPGSLFKGLLNKTLGSYRSAVLIETNRPAVSLPRLPIPDQFKEISKDKISQIFSENGTLGTYLPSFEPRSAQSELALHMADTFNTQSLFVAEAGTGTGKSLAYLIPSALWALTNNCRVLICTRTRNLQDQLISKDLPLVRKIAGEKMNFSALKGRNNYICLHRWKRLLSGESGNLSPRERFAVLPVILWAETTTTGDIEEQNQFNPRWFAKIWNLISAEHHECSGRRCEYFASCFFQQARQKALGSHIVVINHALFFSEICSENSFLGKIGSIVFDEAHHLESCGHRYLRVELDSNRLNLFTETLNNLVLKIGELKEEKQIYENGRELRTLLKHFRKRSQGLLQELDQWALSRQKDSKDFQIAYAGDELLELLETAVFESTVNELVDRLYFLKQAIEAHPSSEDFEELKGEVQSSSERASQLKADFQYLIAGKTEDHVFWVEGNHEKGWVKLCGVPLDVGGMLSEVWGRCNGAVVFTSATLSVSNSVEYFKRGVGLGAYDFRTTVGQYKSPFGAHQAIMGAVRNGPEPDSSQFPQYVASLISRLHQECRKNILVLFTANSMLNAVYDQLRSNAEIEQGKLLAQGMSGTRQNMLDQFKQNQQMILLGTDSFWEGIDAPGEACEIVIIPRLPFPVPTHPLTQAISKRLEKNEGESFFSYSLPEAVIKFRQGAGRLIRTLSDRGALVVLDNRIVTKGYGKKFIKSMDWDFKSFDDPASMITSVKEFFESDATEQISDISYVPLEEV